MVVVIDGKTPVSLGHNAIGEMSLGEKITFAGKVTQITVLVQGKNKILVLSLSHCPDRAGINPLASAQSTRFLLRMLTTGLSGPFLEDQPLELVFSAAGFLNVSSRY